MCCVREWVCCIFLLGIEVANRVHMYWQYMQPFLLSYLIYHINC